MTSPTVSLNSTPNLLIETEETTALINFNLDSLETETTITIEGSNLEDFDLSQIQVEGGNTNLPQEIQSELNNFLATKIQPQVPGVTIAITTPLGSWSEATGLASIENNTPIEVDDRFEIGSITKTFTATTILKLVEEGLLTLEDTLTDWLPESVTANVPNSSEITIRQLLNHTSGVAEYDLIVLEQAQANPTILLREWQPEEIVALIADSEPFFAPGEAWQYSNTNYTLAGMIIETATENNIAAEMRSRIFDPLDLGNTFFAAEEEIPEGYVSGYLDFDGDGILNDVSIANLSWSWANGAIVSNTEDLTQYAQALYAGDLLSETSKEEMFTLVDTGRGYSYGLGMMSFETPDLGTVVGHRGGTLGFNSNMWYSAEDGFIYVDLANGRSNERLVEDTIPAFTEGVIPTVGNVAAYEEFDFTLSDPNAAISFTVLDDGEVEGEEIAIFNLTAGTGYEINPDANTAEFTILDSTTSLEIIFGSVDGDTIEVSESNQLIFAGDLNDLVDAFTGEGDNRIYAGSGDDTLVLGSSDIVLAGAGDDAIFATFGGDNTITGGAGADQFWIATAELPESANVITDFTSGEDVIGLAGLGIGYGDLDITNTDAGVLVSANSADLALFTNSSLEAIASEDNFTFA